MDSQKIMLLGRFLDFRFSRAFLLSFAMATGERWESDGRLTPSMVSLTWMGVSSRGPLWPASASSDLTAAPNSRIPSPSQQQVGGEGPPVFSSSLDQRNFANPQHQPLRVTGRTCPYFSAFGGWGEAGVLPTAPHAMPQALPCRPRFSPCSALIQEGLAHNAAPTLPEQGL